VKYNFKDKYMSLKVRGQDIFIEKKVEEESKKYPTSFIAFFKHSNLIYYSKYASIMYIEIGF